jgi:monofunctional biosynthetic peptidoglycan transglycosylase
MENRKRLKIFLICFLLLMAFLFYLLGYPNISKLKKQNPKKTSFMEYREQEWKVKKKNYKIQQKWVPLKDISPYLIKAILIAEDDKFWSHEGFDYKAIKSALEKDLKAGKFKAGGSTISQQLAKNLYLTPEKSFLRKIEEAALTWRIERALTKRRILELYLNVVEWGDGGIFGIGAAANYYYNKTPAELDPKEAARLAVVLPNPKRFNPLSESKYAQERAELIYDIMVRRGIVVIEYEMNGEENNQNEDEQDKQDEQDNN